MQVIGSQLCFEGEGEKVNYYVFMRAHLSSVCEIGLPKLSY